MAKLNHGEHCIYEFDPEDADKRRLVCIYNKIHREYMQDCRREALLSELLKLKYLKGNARLEAEAIQALDI